MSRPTASHPALRPAPRPRVRLLAGAVFAGAALAGAGACASSAGRYVWADDVAAQAAAPAEYVVAPGDLLAVQVWDNDKLSARARVRDDGRVSLPLLDEVPAAGRTPVQLARDVEQRLRRGDLVLAPRVYVALAEPAPVSVSVIGRVARAGAYALAPGSGVADALASAGGLTEFAHRDRIYVVRRAAGAPGVTPNAMPNAAAGAAPLRVRFTYESATGRSARAAAFRLRAGDVVVVD